MSNPDKQAAHRNYRRSRSLRRTGMAIMAFGAISAPWFFELGRTDTLICWLGAFNVLTLGELEIRLKTAQVRLAIINDELRALRGLEDYQTPDDNLITDFQRPRPTGRGRGLHPRPQVGLGSATAMSSVATEACAT